MLKRPELPDGFQGKVFRDRVRERVAGCVISLCTLFCLLDGGVNIINLVPPGLGSMWLWAACS